jgi:hypothetical protein
MVDNLDRQSRRSTLGNNPISTPHQHLLQLAYLDPCTPIPPRSFLSTMPVTHLTLQSTSNLL